MKAIRLTLISSGITQGMRKHGFPRDEALEKGSVRLARALGARLAHSERSLCGPDLRARQTAELLGLDVTVEAGLRDQDYGIWAGRTLVEIEEEHPGAIAAWLSDPAYVPEGGEPIAGVAARASAFLDEMRQASGHVIVITHPAVIRSAILHILAAPLTAFWRIDTPPLAITDLRSDGRRWVLRGHGSPSR
jgi:broad specificity phosphatase PhoE